MPPLQKFRSTEYIKMEDGLSPSSRTLSLGVIEAISNVVENSTLHSSRTSRCHAAVAMGNRRLSGVCRPQRCSGAGYECRSPLVKRKRTFCERFDDP